MAEAVTSYHVDNDRRFRRAMENAAKVVSDLRVPYAIIARDFYKSEKSIFQLKGPGQYPPFKKKDEEEKSPYQRFKQRKYGFEYPLLVATGALAASITNPNAQYSVFANTRLSLIIGTSVPWAIYHQSDKPRSKIPLRKFIFIGPEAPQFATSQTQGRLERWLNIMNDHILKGLGAKSR